MKNLRIDLIASLALLGLTVGVGTACGSVTTLETPTRLAATPIDSPTRVEGDCLPGATVALPSAAWARDGLVLLREADGSDRELYRFETGADLPGISLFAHGGHLLALAHWYQGAPRWAAVGFDREGRQSFATSGPGSVSGEAFPGEDGSVALNLWVEDHWLLVAVDAAGEVSRLPGLHALGKPIAGLVPIREEDARSATGLRRGWLELSTGLQRPLLREPTGWPVHVPGHFLHLETEAPGHLVVQSPGGVRLFPLDRSTDWLLQATLTARGDTALLTRSVWDASMEILGIDLRTGEQTLHTLPPGERPFGYHSYFGPSPDESGGLLLPLRDASAGGLHRSQERAVFEPLGQLGSAITTLEFSDAGGTYLVWALDYLGYFPMDPWEEGPGADFVGPTLQVLRPSEGIAHTFPLPSETYGQNGRLSEDGLCGVFVDPEYLPDGETRTRLRWLDVRGGRILEEQHEGRVSGPVWLR